MKMIMLPTWLIDSHPLLATLLIVLMGMVAVALAASLRVLLIAPIHQKIIPFMCMLLSLYAVLASNDIAANMQERQVLFLVVVYLTMNLVLVDMCRTVGRKNVCN